MTDLPLGAESGLAVYATANRPGMASCVYSSAATLRTSNERVFSYCGHMWRVMSGVPPEAEDDGCGIGHGLWRWTKSPRDSQDAASVTVNGCNVLIS